MEERDWEKAHREKRRIFYEKATSTLRTCPENYLVAVSREEGGGKVWTATPDAALSTPTREEIQNVLDYMAGNPPWSVAEHLAKDLRWPSHRGDPSIR